MNETPETIALIERSLARAAEQVGDITPAVLARYYEKYPGARFAFQQHSRHRSQLEGEMVQEALYCLMTWFEARTEMTIMLSESLPHHRDVLQVHPEWYVGLIDATAEVIMETIPSDHADEHAAWQKLSRELHAVLGARGSYSEHRRVSACAASRN